MPFMPDVTSEMDNPKTQRYLHLGTLVLLLLTAFSPQVLATCKDDLEKLEGTPMVMLPEDTPADTLILNISDSDTLYMDIDSSIIKIENGKLYTSRNLTLDGAENQELCTSIRDGLFVTLKCRDEANILKFISVKPQMTRDHEPTLELNPINVREHTTNSQLIDLQNPLVGKDDDCDTTVFIAEIVMDDDMKPFFSVSSSVISLIKPLDYEERQTYQLTVVLSSKFRVGGEASDLRSVKGNLTINVLDMDDQDPVFSHQEYYLNVTENTNQDQIIWQEASPPINAFDGDKGINAPIQYDILSSDPSLDVVISDEGQIKVQQVLDRETTDSYTVIVKASQVNKTISSATATLHINVQDVNDNRPKFTDDQVTAATISEAASIGSHVVWLQAHDADVGTNAAFMFNIEDDDDVFEVKQNTATNTPELVVKNSSLLSGQEKISVKITLRETEPLNGGSSCDFISSCVTTITVNVDDVNDNTPEFSKQRYNVKIFDNQKVQEDIVQFEATDDDRDDNARVTFSLNTISGETDCVKVRVNTNSGVLFIDQQMRPSISCIYTVSACDNPTNNDARRCATVPLVFDVLMSASNETENATLFYDVNLQEELPVGTFVYEIPFDGLVIDNENFTLERQALKTATVLDREIQEIHVVSAWRGMPRASVEAVRLSITLTDINDNVPVFTEEYSLTIDDTIHPGDTILKVEALDADKSQGKVTYSLLNMRNIFTINSNTGEVTLVVKNPVAEGLAPEGDSRLLVEASDVGQPVALKSITSVKVYFTSQNGTASVFVPVGKYILVKNKTDVESQLSDVVGVPLKIVDIVNIGPVEDLGSKIFVKSKSRNDTMEPSVLKRLMVQKAGAIHDAIAAQFGKITNDNNGSDNDDDNDDDDDDDDIFTVPFIILLCLVILFFILLAISLYMIYRTRRHYQTQLRLIKNLNADVSIYDKAPLQLNTSVRSNGSANNSSNGSNNVGGVSSREIRLVAYNNPAYIEEDDEADNEPTYSRISHTRPRPNGTTLAVDATATGYANTNNNEQQGGLDEDNSPSGVVNSVANPLYKTTIDVTYPLNSNNDGDEDISGSPATKQSNFKTENSPIKTHSVTSNWTVREDPSLGLHTFSRDRMTYVLNLDTSKDDESPDDKLDDKDGDDDDDDNISSPASSRQRAGSIKAGSEADSGLPSERDIQSDEGNESPKVALTSFDPHLDIMTHKPIYTNIDNTEHGLNSSITSFSSSARNNDFPDEPEPDYEKRVRFNEALKHGEVVELPSPEDDSENYPSGELLATETQITAF